MSSCGCGTYLQVADKLFGCQDYPVQSSWRRRHAAMTPHFVATQVSQTQSGVSQDVAMETGHVRATQDVQQFTPTQDVGQ